MKLVVNKTILERATATLQKVINSKNALTILGDILCEVKDKKMTMTASDSEIYITTTIDLETMEGDGRFCVAANNLKEALSQLTEQPVTIIATTETTNMFTLQHQSGETFFAIEDADNYPMPVQENFDTILDMNGGKLCDAIKRCLWATANDDLRPIMNGVYLGNKYDNTCIDVVASDGHVVVSTSLLKEHVVSDVSAIIPKKAAKILTSILDVDTVTIQISKNMVQVETFSYTLTARLTEGTYPNYNAVVPKDSTHEAIVNSYDMIRSVRKVIPFSNDSSNLLKMCFADNTLELQCEDFDFSMGAKDKFSIEYEDSEAFVIGVKGSRMIDVFSKIGGGNIILSMTDSNRAIIFEPEEQDEGLHVLMLAMPLLIND